MGQRVHPRALAAIRIRRRPESVPPSLRRDENYLAYLRQPRDNYIVNYGLGDWYDIGPKHPGVAQLTPIALTATAFYFQDLEIMSRAAALLGKTDDAKQFSGLAEKIRSAFNEKFYEPTNHILRHRLPNRQFHPARDGLFANRPIAPPCWTPSSAMCAIAATR
jgi:glycogen debranching enzyme